MAVKVKNSQRRGQESVAFMIIIGIALILFLLFSGIIIDDLDTALTIKELTKVRTVSDKLASAIHRSSLSGPGTSENITLEQIEDNYTLLIKTGSVIALTNKGVSYTSITRTSRVFEKNITYGSYEVRNLDGWVNVSEI